MLIHPCRKVDPDGPDVLRYAFGTDTFYPHDVPLSALVNPDMSVYDVDIQNISTNAAFLVLCKSKERMRDLTRDSTGVYRQSNKNEDGYDFRNGKMVREEGGHWTLIRKYYYHKYESFSRRVIYFVRDRGTRNENYFRDAVWIEYHFDKTYTNSSDLLRVHGNAKVCERKFTGLKVSVRAKLKDCLLAYPVCRAKQMLIEERGGLSNIAAPSEIPTSMTAYNMTAMRQPGNSKVDDISSLITGILDDEHLFPLVRFWSLQPFIILIASDYSLSSMALNVTDPTEFYPVTIDPTFGLGKFTGTSFVYRNLKLHSIRQDRDHPHHQHYSPSPIRIGAFVIHLQKDMATYARIFHELLIVEPRLTNIQSIGTDGEFALYNSGLIACESSPIHLRCFRHLCDNIERALQGIPSPPNWKYDIFGSDHVPDLQDDVLVDSTSEEEFDRRLHKHRVAWSIYDANESLYGIVQELSQVFKKNTLASVRTAAGLGLPPAKFYTNTSESMNFIQKRFLSKGSTREKSMIAVVNGVTMKMRSDETEDECAYVGRGEVVKIRPKWEASLLIKNFWDLPQSAKEAELQKCKSISLQQLSMGTPTEPKTSMTKLTSQVEKEIHQFVGDNKKLDIEIVRPMFYKAMSILDSCDNLQIQRAPTRHPNAFSVPSKSSSRPEHVELTKIDSDCTEATCTCTNFRCHQCCSHVIAVCRQQKELSAFGNFLRVRKLGTNVTRLVASRMNVNLSRVGKKPGQLRRRRVQHPCIPSVPVSVTSQPKSFVQKPVVKCKVRKLTNVPSWVPGPSQLSKSATSVQDPVGKNKQAGHFTRVLRSACRQIKVCFGCRREFTDADIHVVKNFEPRPFYDPRTGGLTHRLGFTYYHDGLRCVQIKHPHIISI
jgi:hypothetical protein